MSAPYAYADPSAPTLQEATTALTMANHWREKYLTERRNCIEISERANRLEAELTCAIETSDEAEREAREAWAA